LSKKKKKKKKKKKITNNFSKSMFSTFKNLFLTTSGRFGAIVMAVWLLYEEDFQILDLGRLEFFFRGSIEEVKGFVTFLGVFLLEMASGGSIYLFIYIFFPLWIKKNVYALGDLNCTIVIAFVQ